MLQTSKLSHRKWGQIGIHWCHVGEFVYPKANWLYMPYKIFAWIWHSSGQVSEFAPPNRLFALAPAYQDQTQNNQLSITQLEWQLWTCHDDRTSRSRFVNTFLWEISLSIQFYTRIRVHILGIHTGSDVVSWSKSYVSTFLTRLRWPCLQEP